MAGSDLGGQFFSELKNRAVFGQFRKQFKKQPKSGHEKYYKYLRIIFASGLYAGISPHKAR